MKEAQKELFAGEARAHSKLLCSKHRKTEKILVNVAQSFELKPSRLEPGAGMWEKDQVQNPVESERPVMSLVKKKALKEGACRRKESNYSKDLEKQREKAGDPHRPEDFDERETAEGHPKEKVKLPEQHKKVRRLRYTNQKSRGIPGSYGAVERVPDFQADANDKRHLFFAEHKGGAPKEFR